MDPNETAFLDRDDLLQRLHDLERDNARLRKRIEKVHQDDHPALIEPTLRQSAIADADIRIEELMRSRDALLVTESRFRALLESATDYAIITLDLNGVVLSWNKGAKNILGWDEEEAVGRHGEFFFLPEDREARIPQHEMVTALAKGRAEDNRWHLKKDGSKFWASGAVMPFHNSELLGFLKILRDRTQERDTDLQLRKSEEQLREILESISDAFYAVDRDWRLTYINSKTEQWWGRSREELIGKNYPETFPAIVGSEAFDAHVHAMEERCPVHIETLSPILDHWVDVNIYPTADGGLSVYFRDITQRKKAEEHQRILLHELNHRVKNTLATVQSIAAQTLRNANSINGAKEALETRLFALSRAHDVLTRENWDAADLHEIVAQSIEPYLSYGANRILCEGPHVRIPPRMALAFAMAFQELATNAVKYGALRNERGRIAIRWSIEHSQNSSCLRVHWEEADGPPVRKPERLGFGARLIERSLAHDLNGTARIIFAPTGILCDVEAPLTQEEELQLQV
jgi:PAS domain S-box-containing protein